jgi:DHA2 family multidrug resistance protein
LDRGATLDWFSSGEVVFEGIISVLSFYMFVAHMLTSRTPFVDPGLFKDRNYMGGLFMTFCFQGMINASMVLWPNMIQTLMGYPIITTGLILMPRGVAAMIGMATVARLLPRFGAPPLMLVGMAISVVSVWMTSRFNINVSAMQLAAVGFIQGLGMGLAFVPINVLTYATLPPRLISQATPFNALVRNIGSSIGISIMVALVSHYTIVNHAVLTESLNLFNMNTFGFMPAVGDQTETAAVVDRTITQQATMIGYCNAFVAMTYAMLFLPLTLLTMRRIKTNAPASSALAHEL